MELDFPLFERAERAGILDGKSALIVAPTATGKSHIGREAIRRALERKDPGTHAYLVPFRALAEEIYDSFLDLLKALEARVRISTGDHRDPFRPEDANLVVATYESFTALIRRAAFHLGIVVADEVHLVADDHRGPVVEGLFARLLASGRASSLVGLSAVVENGEELAAWLGIPLMKGTVADRPVPLSLAHTMASDRDAALIDLLAPCFDGQQGLVFCNSRAGAEKVARLLAPLVEEHLPKAARRLLQTVAEHVQQEDPEVEDTIELLPLGVAYHHAGLPKPVRRHIEDVFRQGLIRIVTATPTLAAGVNLPADIVVVRDIYRSEVVRGRHRRVLLPSGEVLNMLGRAGRPGHVPRGTGIALIEQRFAREAAVKELVTAVKQGRGGAVESRLAESFEGLMRFVLGVVVEKGEATREDVAQAFSKTLAYYAAPAPISFDREFRDDMMEDLPAYEKVVDAAGAICLVDYHLSAEGVHVEIDSSGKRYEVTIGVTGVECTCPAASQFYRGRICKHQACAIHDLLFAGEIDEEARARAIYNCGHVFGTTLDAGTRLDLALQLLTQWRLIERIPSGWRATPIGDIAALSTFDLLMIHQTAQRVANVESATYREVAGWAVEDYFAEEKDRERWKVAVEKWLDEVDQREIRLPTRYRGDFESGLEDLARLCLLYERAAIALGESRVAEAARVAAHALRYGVAPELVPLMALGFPQLARARSRYLYERGIENVHDLAAANPAEIADPRRAPESLVRQWVERALEIHQARAVATADREEADQEFDELVARFRLDPAALT
jgi:helicase